MYRKQLISVADFKEAAKLKLETPVKGFYQSGAEACSTTHRNEEAFSLIKLRQRILQGKITPHFDMSTSIFGKKVSSPICIAPVGLQMMAHPQGEIGVMKAAEKRRTGFCLSTGSNVELAMVAKHGPNVPKIMQLYNFKTQDQNQQFFERAERAGFDGIAVTIDTPFLGFKRADIRNSFALPPHLKYMNQEKASTQNMKTNPPLPGETYTQHYARTNHELQLDWEDIKALRRLTKLKLIIKGLMSPEDSEIAAQYAKEGMIDAVWVSNHGGRQLDQTISTIEALPQVVKHLDGIVPIWFDGGVRKGTDVLKALALGADIVFIGRPIIWGLAAQGQQGVEGVLNALESELRRAMILTGVSNILQVRTKNIIYRQVPKL